MEHQNQRDYRRLEKKVKELIKQVEDQTQREEDAKIKYRGMIREERNLTDEKTQQVIRLEMEVEELKNHRQEEFSEQQRDSIMKLEEKTLQVSRLELEVKEKEGQLKELKVEQRALKIIVTNKDEEIFHLTKEQVKREIEDEIWNILFMIQETRW